MKNHRLIIISLLLIATGILAPVLLNQLFTVPHKQEKVVQKLPLPTPVLIETALHHPATEISNDALEKTENVIEIFVQPGDSLAKIFNQHQLNPALITTILAINDDTAKLRNIQPGQQILLTLDENDQLKQLIVSINKKENLILTLDGQDFHTDKELKELTARTKFSHGEIEHSLYLAAKAAGLPEKIIQQLTSVFAWNIDYAKELRRGDNFVVLYDEYYFGDEKIETGDIIAAKFINQGSTYTAIRHTDNAGVDHYYTSEGNSLRKAFLRHPVRFSHISSPFNPRRMHPILKVVRPHNGVDFAAPIGTPIKAAGDGTIDFIGNNGGYGNMIKIRHTAELTTLYAHMLRFAEGLKNGNRVKQGDTIGYVGQSGLATGPHLHYEFHVNSRPANPITVELPNAAPIDESLLANFTIQANEYMAQLELYEQTQLAMTEG